MKSIIVFFLLRSISDITDATQVGSIQNASLVGAASSLSVNGTCIQCICIMLTSNQSFLSLNCFQNNGTCTLFFNYLQNVSYRMQDANKTAFFFLTLPPGPISSLSWPFDGSVNEVANRVNVVPNSNISFISPGIYGLGSAVYFNGSQYLSMSTTYLNMSSNSFTFEMWVYPTALQNSHIGILGMCQSANTDLCLHIAIRSSRAYLGFYSDDCTGNTIIANQTWYHLAFVYNSSNRNQLIYINGNLDSNRVANLLNITVNVPLLVGEDTFITYNDFFTGYMDQLSYVNRAKSSNEILTDVFLLAYFSFNQNSLLDSGSYHMSGTAYQLTLINNAILFNQTFSSFQIQTFDLTGVFDSSFSIALWIQPLSTNGSTIVHIVGNSTTNNSFCYDLLGFNNQSRLIAQMNGNGTISIVGPSIVTNTWTYVTVTFSPTNGIRLYVNGTLKNGTGPSTSLNTKQSQTVTLGNCLRNCQTCSVGLISSKPYVGLIDEFRIYSRELNTTDIQPLIYQ